MRIHSIFVENYRGIRSRQVTFRDQGVTIISGPNQSGKSSIIEAMGVVLSEKATSTKSLIKDIHTRGKDIPAVVEMEMTIGDERLRLRKEFGRGRKGGTVVEFLEGLRAPLQGDPAHNYVQQLLAEHEDMALFKALQFLQGEDLHSFELTAGQSSLQHALDAAAAAQFGDGAGDTLLEAARREYAQYFTPTGREGKVLQELKTQVEQHRQLVAECQDHLLRVENDAAQVSALEGDLVEKAIRLAELEQQVEVLQKDANLHRDQIVQMERIKGELVTCQAKAAAVQALHSQEVNRQHYVSTFAVRQQGVKEQMAELGEFIQPWGEDQENHYELVKQGEERVRLEASFWEIMCRQHDYKKMVAARHHAQVRWDEARAVVASLSHDPALHVEAQRCVMEAQSLQATLHAMTGTVSVTPLIPHTAVDGGESSVPVVVNGEEVWGECECDLVEPVVVEVPEQVRIDISPGVSAGELRQQLAEVEAECQRLWNDLGVRNAKEADEQSTAWAQATVLVTEMERKLRAEEDECASHRPEERLAEIDSMIATFAPELVQRMVARWEACASRQEEESSGEQLKEAYSTASEQLLRLEQERRSWWEQREHSQRRVEDLARELATIEEEQSQLSEDSDAPAVEVLAAQCELLKKECDGYEAALRQQEEALSSGVNSVELLLQAQQHCEDVREEWQRLSQDHARGVAQLEVRLEEGYSGQLAEAKNQLADSEQAYQEVAEAAAAAKLLCETLDAARARAAQRYQAPYVEALSRLGRSVWGDFFSVSVGEDLQIVAAVTRPGGLAVEYGALSVGTQEQLAVLSRLACYELVTTGRVPVVFDDILGYSDPELLDNMATAVGKVATAGCEGALGQIFIFTCDNKRFSGVEGVHHHWENLGD